MRRKRVKGRRMRFATIGSEKRQRNSSTFDYWSTNDTKPTMTLYDTRNCYFAIRLSLCIFKQVPFSQIVINMTTRALVDVIFVCLWGFFFRPLRFYLLRDIWNLNTFDSHKKRRKSWFLIENDGSQRPRYRGFLHLKAHQPRSVRVIANFLLHLNIS